MSGSVHLSEQAVGDSDLSVDHSRHALSESGQEDTKTGVRAVATRHSNLLSREVRSGRYRERGKCGDRKGRIGDGAASEERSCKGVDVVESKRCVVRGRERIHASLSGASNPRTVARLYGKDAGGDSEVVCAGDQRGRTCI